MDECIWNAISQQFKVRVALSAIYGGICPVTLMLQLESTRISCQAIVFIPLGLWIFTLNKSNIEFMDFSARIAWDKWFAVVIASNRNDVRIKRIKNTNEVNWNGEHFLTANLRLCPAFLSNVRKRHTDDKCGRTYISGVCVRVFYFIQTLRRL